MSSLLSSLLLQLVACGCQGPAGEGNESGHLDSMPRDTVTDSASADSGDSVAPEGGSLAGELVLMEDCELDAEPTVAAVRLHFGDGPALGETLAAAPGDLSKGFRLDYPAMPGGELEQVSRDNPELAGAFYVLLVFEDANGDQAYQEGEPLLGGSLERWLVWLEGVAQREEAQDWPLGWSQADLGIAGQHEPNRCLLDTDIPMEWRTGYPLFFDPIEAVSLRLQGLQAELTMGGAVAAWPEGAGGLAGLPYPSLANEPVYDLSLEEPTEFQASLSAPPPDSHDANSDADWRYTMHLNLVYQDEDGDGAYGAPDSFEGSTTCLGDEVVWARFTRSVSSYRGYRFLECYGGTVGWRAVMTDPESGAPLYLASHDARSLVLDSSTCRLD